MSSLFSSKDFKLWSNDQYEFMPPWLQFAQWDLKDFPWPWQQEDWLNLSASGRHYLFVWHPEAGFALWELDGKPAAYLLKVLTRPSFRRRGLSQALLAFSEEWLKEHGFASGVLEVQCENEAAIALYKSQGWKDLRRIKRFYNDGSDALSMQKIFS